MYVPGPRCVVGRVVLSVAGAVFYWAIYIFRDWGEAGYGLCPYQNTAFKNSPLRLTGSDPEAIDSKVDP